MYGVDNALSTATRKTRISRYSLIYLKFVAAGSFFRDEKKEA